jgi:hypothetical protein
MKLGMTECRNPKHGPTALKIVKRIVGKNNIKWIWRK